MQLHVAAYNVHVPSYNMHIPSCNMHVSCTVQYDVRGGCLRAVCRELEKPRTTRCGEANQIHCHIKASLQSDWCATTVARRYKSMILLISRFFEQRGIFRGRVESSTSLLFYR